MPLLNSIIFTYLNKSHVKVKPGYIFLLGLALYLNTSHVKVKLVDPAASGGRKKFKYISC